LPSAAGPAAEQQSAPCTGGKLRPCRRPALVVAPVPEVIRPVLASRGIGVRSTQLPRRRPPRARAGRQRASAARADRPPCWATSGIRVGVLRVVSAGGFVYRIVPGRLYMQTWVYRAAPAKTDGDASTGGLVSVRVHLSDDSWMPDSRITVGLSLPRQRRYSLRPEPTRTWPAKLPCAALRAAARRCSSPIQRRTGQRLRPSLRQPPPPR